MVSHLVNKSKKVILIGLLLIIGIGIMIFINKSEKKLKAGDKFSHVYRYDAYVNEIIDKKTIRVNINLSVDDDKIFENEELILDCSKQNDLSIINVGDNIVFYFLRYNVDGNFVKVDKIEIKK